MKTYKTFKINNDNKIISIELKKLTYGSFAVFFDGVRLMSFADKAEAECYFEGLLDMARFTQATA